MAVLRNKECANMYICNSKKKDAIVCYNIIEDLNFEYWNLNVITDDDVPF